MKYILWMVSIAIVTVVLYAQQQAQADNVQNWQKSWPKANFSKTTINISKIMSGGPPRDGIPAIDNPSFESAKNISNIGANEPVIVLSVGKMVKAYPLRVLMWHEIVNDVILDVPVTVTYCPLCNASVAFERRIDGQILDFGVTGKLYNSDMLMYDRQTESWWQQFTGQAVIGDMVGQILKRLPSRVMPFSIFKDRNPNGLVLVPSNSWGRNYGRNPYVSYDSAKMPFLFNRVYDGDVPAMSYVVSVGGQAWSLNDVREKQIIETTDGLKIEWVQGMNSALDTEKIQNGKDIGYLHVQKHDEVGIYHDVPYDMTFAFVFFAFHPDGVLHE